MDLSQPYTAICPSLEGPVLDVLSHTTHPLTGREISRLARRGSERGVRLVLQKLVAHGLVSSQQAGTALLFSLNRDHVAADLLERLFQLRTELIERIGRDVESWSPAPIHVSLFGSAARGDGDVGSDIDLLVVRPEDVSEDDQRWREQLHRLAEKVHLWSGNHASLHETTAKRLIAAARAEEPIIASLRESSIAIAGLGLAELTFAPSLTPRRRDAVR